jgi:hypothetical protein
MSESKDFYKITDLSLHFKAWQSEQKPLDSVMHEIQLWQARFMLGIAQQLSVIASHLGKIVRKAENNGQN